ASGDMVALGGAVLTKAAALRVYGWIEGSRVAMRRAAEQTQLATNILLTKCQWEDQEIVGRLLHQAAFQRFLIVADPPNADEVDLKRALNELADMHCQHYLVNVPIIKFDAAIAHSIYNRLQMKLDAAEQAVM